MRGYNFVDREEFEFIDGVYRSEKRLMTENLVIEDVEEPLARAVLGALGNLSRERVKEFFRMEDYMFARVRNGEVRKDESYDKKVGDDGVVLLGGAGYVFGENFTYREDRESVSYVEVGEGYSISVNGVNRYNVERALRKIMLRGELWDHVKKFIKADGRVSILIWSSSLSGLKGNMRYVGGRKEFVSKVIIGFEKMSIHDFPTRRGLYNVTLHPLDGLELGSLDARVKRMRLVHKYRLRDCADLSLVRKITNDPEEGITFDFGPFKVVEDYYSNAFAIRVGEYLKVVSCDELAVIFDELFKDPEAIFVL